MMTRFAAYASLATAVLLGATLATAITAGAQQFPGQQTQPVQKSPPVAKGTLPAAKEGAGTTENALRQRVEQLEEQLMDMQVLVGTLESLAKGVTAGGTPGARSMPGASAALDASVEGRLDGLETQLRALAAQLEQLQEQMRALAARSGGLTTGTSVATAEPPPFGKQVPDKSGFGAVTVTPDTGKPDPGKKDEITRVLTEPGATQQPGGGQDADADPKQLYSTAYGYLIQRDYPAAETAFEDFLRQYPNHPLAGNATYWMGESLYVRGQYRAAASAFLKGYQTYGKNEKAPESLLKLAMSLQKLGQKDAACSSFNELSTKFPNAPQRVKNTAQTERQRVGC